MLEALVLGVLAILALCAVVAIPLLLIGAVVKVLFFFLLLPFKILKGILAAVAGVALGVGKLFLVFAFLLAVAALARTRLGGAFGTNSVHRTSPLGSLVIATGRSRSSRSNVVRKPLVAGNVWFGGPEQGKLGVLDAGS
mgnify:CR=1 FL=1